MSVTCSQFLPRITDCVSGLSSLLANSSCTSFFCPWAIKSTYIVFYCCAVLRSTEAVPRPGWTRENRAGIAGHWSADAGHLTSGTRRAGGRESQKAQRQMAGHTWARLQTQGIVHAGPQLTLIYVAHIWIAQFTGFVSERLYFPYGKYFNLLLNLDSDRWL